MKNGPDIKRQAGLMILISLMVIGLAAFLPPVSQSIDYHQFADQRSLIGIPNFSNVVSNLALVLSGLSGMLLLWRINRETPQQFQYMNESRSYWVLFLGIATSGLGSMYYHWIPDNEHLLWDRLPISISITALLAATISDRISPRLGLWLLPVLIFLGIASVLYWSWTEQQGAGNLNYYAVTQFYSILLILWICLRCTSRYNHENAIYQAIAWYGVAKVAETLDQSIFLWTADWISGHTLKHLIAAYATYCIVMMLQKRRLVNT